MPPGRPEIGDDAVAGRERQTVENLVPAQGAERRCGAVDRQKIGQRAHTDLAGIAAQRLRSASGGAPVERLADGTLVDDKHIKHSTQHGRLEV